MGDEIKDGIEVVGITLKIKGQEVTLDVDAAEKTIKTMERLLGLTKRDDVLNPYDLGQVRRQMEQPLQDSVSFRARNHWYSGNSNGLIGEI